MTLRKKEINPRKQSRMPTDSMVKRKILRKSMSGMEMVLQSTMNMKLSIGMPVLLPLKMRKSIQSTMNSTDMMLSYVGSFWDLQFFVFHKNFPSLQVA